MTPLGLMVYNRLPMGLKDAAAVFQKCVSKTLSNCKNTMSFVDDILVYGRTHKEHDDALEEVFSSLDSKEFRVNLEKCQFGRNKITFLGFCIDASGIRPNPDKIEPIKNAASPTTLKQLQGFLGAVNYLSEFVPPLADLAEPLRL